MGAICSENQGAQLLNTSYLYLTNYGITGKPDFFRKEATSQILQPSVGWDNYQMLECQLESLTPKSPGWQLYQVSCSVSMLI